MGNSSESTSGTPRASELEQSPGSGGAGGGVGRSELPLLQETFSGIDKAIIVFLILLFLGLFVWLLQRPDQSIFQYWVFTALLTLVFVGILRAAGVIRTGWLVLAGSAAVYIGLLWATTKGWNQYHTDRQKIAELTSQTDSLQQKLTAATAALAEYKGQDLRIVTLNATNQRTVRYLKFSYVLGNGNEKPALLKEEGYYAIPAADLHDIQVIWMEFNLRGAGAPERAGGVESKKFKVERLKLQTQPLQIVLFVSIEGEV